ncbi:DUF982 domain-containing protein [Rhizobium leguminosarum]|uniref:DUF982 domain-containing protein n=1 Tax=Rhizobium leguminosarum TaxID=384 RepID=UPI000DD4F265
MCWNTSSAFTPVGIILRGTATRRVVRTLGDAAHLLMKEWPSDDEGFPVLPTRSSPVNAARRSSQKGPGDLKNALARCMSPR